MMLIEADAVVAEFVEQFPRVEMFVVGLDGFLRLEMRLAERVGQRLAGLKCIEMLAIRQQVEDENLHRRSPAEGFLSCRTLADPVVSRERVTRASMLS